MRRTVAAVGLALVLVVTACGGEDRTDSAVRARSALGMGEKVTFPNGETVQVHSFEAEVRPDAAGGAPAGAGRSYAVVDVEACAGTEGGATAEAGKFELEMPDGTRIPPVPVVAREPALRAPGAPGQCNRGTVTYELGSGLRPRAVAFLGPQAAVRWQVS
jgi:hypothetical protein